MGLDQLQLLGGQVGGDLLQRGRGRGREVYGEGGKLSGSEVDDGQEDEEHRRLGLVHPE